MRDRAPAGTGARKAGGPRWIDVLHEEALFPVRNVPDASAVGIDEAGRRLLVSHGVIHAREVDGVLDGAGDHGFLVVGSLGIAPV